MNYFKGLLGCQADQHLCYRGPIKRREKWAEDQTDISPKTYRCPTSTQENAQHHWLIEKCQSKLQWGTTSHQSEGSSLTSQQVINAW